MIATSWGWENKRSSYQFSPDCDNTQGVVTPIEAFVTGIKDFDRQKVCLIGPF